MAALENPEPVILLAHGDGGALTRALIAEVFQKYFTAEELGLLMDAAVLSPGKGRPALTTDSFVVDPLFFPGGDIGRLAVWGTVNDLAVSGARPQYLAASFLIEEGLPLNVLEKVAAAMGEACREAGVEIVAGDTKVVERGHLDKLFITTTGVGWRPEHVELGYHRIEPGDLLLVNGPPGEHGVAVLAGRYGLELDGRLKSDLAPLNGIVEELLTLGTSVKLMRDLTRGGLATAVKEIALPAGVDVFLEEEAVPVSPEVRGAARLLGLDPLYLASEGKFLAVVAQGEAEAALEILRGHPLGRQAAVIGEVTAGKGNVYLKTPFGGTKILDFLAGDPLPRIC